MADIATLGLEIRSDGVVVASQRLRQFQGEGAKTQTVATKTAGALKLMAVQFVAAAAAAVSLGAIGRTLAGFEHSMGAVAAVTRATQQELTGLRNIAKELGGTTEFTASQAADGLRFLGMAGWSAVESIKALPSVLDLATAANMGLAASADITSNIMSAFGLGAAGAGDVADVLAAASSRANTDVTQLGDAMKYAGPVASALGMDIGQTAAAMGTLSDAGIQGSMAGTGLRRVLSSLANPTKEATGVLSALGIKLSEVNPATNDLVDIVELLAAKGISAADALTIFGDRGGPAILALVENNGKLRELTTTLTDVDGEATRMAKTMRDTLMGDFKNLESASESVVIALGEAGLTGALRSVTQLATTVLRAAAENIERLLYWAGAAATFFAGPWVVGIVAARVATLGLSGALTVLRGALIRTGVGALVVLAGELIYQFVQLVERSGGFGEAMMAIGRTGADVWNRITLGAQAMGKYLEGVALWIEGGFTRAFANIATTFADLVAGIAPAAAAMGIELDATGAAAFARGRHLKAAEREAGSALAFMQGGDLLARSMKGASPMDGIGDGSTLAQLAEFRDGVDGVTESLGGGGGGGGLSDAAKKAAASYADLVRSGQQFITDQQNEARALGMTSEAAARMRHEQDLLNKAANDNINLTPKQTAELGALATAMAGVEERTRRLTEVYELGGSVTRGVLGDLRSGLMEGVSLWDNFANAGANALNKIAEKALDMAAGGIWDMIFGAFSGAIGGGMGGGGGMLTGAARYAGSGGFYGIPSFEGGGDTGGGSRTGGMDGRGGFPAILHPRETVVDHTRAANGNSVSVIRIELGEGLRAGIVQEAVGQSVEISGKMVAPVAKAVGRMGQQGRF